MPLHLYHLFQACSGKYHVNIRMISGLYQAKDPILHRVSQTLIRLVKKYLYQIRITTQLRSILREKHYFHVDILLKFINVSEAICPPHQDV